MLGERLVVVADAHLGYAPPEVEAALLEFLDAVPALGDSLLVNGDLFEFWFGYARVIPRHGFRVAAALAQLARRMPVVLVGGNHDRWGLRFWDDLGIRYAPDRAEFRLGERRVLALHGDEVGSGRRRSDLLRRAVSTGLAGAVYRALHPELALPLVQRLSARFTDHATEGPSVERCARRQREWADRLLAQDPSLGLLVMGHSHRAVLVEAAPGRQYLNPGAWFDGFRYAVADGRGAELRRFTPSAPLPPARADRR